MKYMRKTPVEAIQWNGTNRKEVHDFIINAANSCCTQDDGFGRLIIVFENLREQAIKTVLPKYGWAVREGKTFQFYKDATFHKTFEEVQKGEIKGVDWEGMDKTIKEAFDGFDDAFKGFNDVFRSKPSKKESDVFGTMVRLNNKGRLAKLIDDLYNGDEKTREEVKKQLSEGLKEIEDSDKTKGTESDTFESVLDEMKELHAKKDKDYGSAFHKSFEEFGVTAGVVRLNDKMERVKALVKNGKAEVKEESLLDTLKDMSSYAVMLYVELKNKENG